jgi:hypothetical protein
MKLSTLFLAVVFAGVCYLVWISLPQQSAPGTASSSSASVPVSPSPATPTLTPAPSALPTAPSPAPVLMQCKREDLVLVHGVVSRIQPKGITVDCTPPDDAGVGSLPPQGRESARKRLQQFTEDNDKRTYGPVMTLEGGRYHETDSIPSRRAQGTILLIGHPEQQTLTIGHRIHVVAAPVDNLTVYTMVFQAPAGSSNSWMWKKSKMDAP